jgi:hypothetical protein
MIVNEERKRWMYKEAAVAYFYVQFQHFSGGTEQNYGKSQRG